MTEDKIQENKPETGTAQAIPESTLDSSVRLEDMTNFSAPLGAEVGMPQPAPHIEPEQLKKPTYITDFPYCPVRVGRVSESVAEDGGRSASAIPTCGYREVKLKDCLECNFQHALKENKILNGKKVVKNTEDIRELKQRLDITENDVEDLKKIIGYLIHGVVMEIKKEQ